LFRAEFDATFDLDANGSLNISAIEKSTGKKKKVTITTPTTRLVSY
jgi:heat shock 70kDa protein 1/2/6/8